MAETTFKRNSAAEAAAIAAGIATKEEINARGGINASGYFGDSYREGITLTDEEYASAIKAAKESGATGTAIGSQINKASENKLRSYYTSKGYTPSEIEGLISGSFRLSQSGNVIKISDTKDTSASTGATGATGFGPGTPGYTDRKSAYDLLYSQFNQYGLGSLVEPLKNLITEGVSPSEFTIRLRETDAYKKRFAANAARINQGLRALSEAEYIGLEDQYQDIMRRYGMPESYYKKGDLGTQAGFEKFIGFDVSPVELEDRIQTAQSRVFDANPEVAATLKQFYPGITNGDILAYVLDPKSALPELKRKITAAEIGAGAAIAGLQTGLQRATELASYGVTKEQAQQGFQTIADILPRGSQLSSIYGQPEYTQTTAEQEVFGLAGATEAAKQRKKLTALEQASFSGTSGMAGTALGRERAGQF